MLSWSEVKQLQEERDTLAARLAEVEADRDIYRDQMRDSFMQSLADLGQAQEAYEAQKAAEAREAKLREIGDKMAASIEGNYFLPGIATEWRKAAALQEKPHE